MNKVIDFMINLCRWPVALMLLFSLPALVKSYQYFNFFNRHFYYMAAGIVFFWFIAITAGRELRSQIQTIAHELTHTLFAFLTLHFVKRVRLNPDGSGGSMAFAGHGNWLITLAPYFFPLFASIYMLIMPCLDTLLPIIGKLFFLKCTENRPTLFKKDMCFPALSSLGLICWLPAHCLRLIANNGTV